MEVGQRIKRIRESKELSTNDLSRLTGISQSTISKLENGKRKAELSTLEKIADALNVSVDKFTGESASSIIEDRLKDSNITLDEVANRAKVPLYWLQNLDTFIPGEWGGRDDIAYKWITKVAKVLGLPGSTLRAALARQEIPVYDGPPDTRSLEEIFAEFEEELDDNNAEPNDTHTSTLAAHKTDGYDDDLTEEEQRAVRAFIETYRKQFSNRDKDE